MKDVKATKANTVEAITNTKELSTMTKSELVEAIIEYENLLITLEDKISRVQIKPEGRKAQVLKILKTGHISVEAIGNRIGISSRNVSSQLSYLRKDGYAIATDSLGKKFLESQTPTSAEPVKVVQPSILRKA